MSFYRNLIAGTFATALFAGAASAHELTQLTDAQLDGVSAGGFIGFAFAATGPGFASGTSVFSAEQTAAVFIDNTVATSTSIQPDITAASAVAIFRQGVGAGATSAGGSGFLGVFISPF